MLSHCNLNQNLCLCSKQSSLFSFYALPSGGKSKDAVVHCLQDCYFGDMLSAQIAKLSVSLEGPIHLENLMVYWGQKLIYLGKA